MKPAPYRLEELEGLAKADRHRLRATVEELEHHRELVKFLRIAAGPARIVAVEFALEHSIDRSTPEHDRAACLVCVAIDRVDPFDETPDAPF